VLKPDSAVERCAIAQLPCAHAPQTHSVSVTVSLTHIHVTPVLMWTQSHGLACTLTPSIEKLSYTHTLSLSLTHTHTHAHRWGGGGGRGREVERERAALERERAVGESRLNAPRRCTGILSPFLCTYSWDQAEGTNVLCPGMVQGKPPAGGQDSP